MDVNNKLQTIQGNKTVTGTWTFLGESTSTAGFRVDAGDRRLTAWNNGTNPFVRYNTSTNRWQFSDNGTDTTNLATSSAAGLSASSTSGIGITNSEIHILNSSTQGMAFGVDGRIYQQVSSTRGLINTSTGTYITTTPNLTFTSAGLLDVYGSSTPGVANSIVITSSTGRLNPYFIGTSTISSTFADPFLRSTSTGAYWATTTLAGITVTSTMNQSGKIGGQNYYNSSTVSVLAIIEISLSGSSDSTGDASFFLDTVSTTAMYKVSSNAVNGGGSATDNSVSFTNTFIIPPGWYFKVVLTTTGSGATASIIRWNEIPLF